MSPPFIHTENSISGVSRIINAFCPVQMKGFQAIFPLNTTLWPLRPYAMTVASQLPTPRRLPFNSRRPVHRQEDTKVATSSPFPIPDSLLVFRHIPTRILGSTEEVEGAEITRAADSTNLQEDRFPMIAKVSNRD